MNKETVIQRLCALAPKYLEYCWGRTNTCMQSSDLAVAVLNHFGYKARLQHVKVFAGCPIGWAHIIGDIRIEDLPEDGWWTMACLPTKPPGYKTPLAHVVCVSGDHMVDLTLGQFNRPGKNIILPSAHWDQSGEFAKSDEGQIYFFVPKNGGGVGYKRISSKPWLEDARRGRELRNETLPGMLNLISDDSSKKRLRASTLREFAGVS